MCVFYKLNLKPWRAITYANCLGECHLLGPRWDCLLRNPPFTSNSLVEVSKMAQHLLIPLIFWIKPTTNYHLVANWLALKEMAKLSLKGEASALKAGRPGILSEGANVLFEVPAQPSPVCYVYQAINNYLLSLELPPSYSPLQSTWDSIILPQSRVEVGWDL